MPRGVRSPSTIALRVALLFGRWKNMYADTDASWRPEGATGFGTRLLLDLALNFTRPKS